MTHNNLYVDGELYLTLEVVAELYEVRAVWLREVYDSGLLGNGLTTEASISIAAVKMDRVATIVRLHQGLGLDLDTIAVALETARDDAGH